MPDHASPCRDQTHGQKLCTNKGSYNTDTPHSGDITGEGYYGITHPLHHTLDNDGDPVEGFRNGHHTQNCDTKQNYLLVLTEQPPSY